MLKFISDQAKTETKKDNDTTKRDEEKAEENVVIDFDGLSERIEALPIARGNYRNLAVNESSLFYMNKDEGDFNRFEFRVPNTMDLYSFSF